MYILKIVSIGVFCGLLGAILAQILWYGIKETRRLLFGRRYKKMKKHIHISADDKHKEDFTNDSNFKHNSEYSPIDYHKLLQNEIGSIETEDNVFHVLLGNIRDHHCPWCDGETDVVFVNLDDRYLDYFIKCFKCSSRGPSMKVNETMTLCPDGLSEVVNLLLCSYSKRRPWFKCLDIED